MLSRWHCMADQNLTVFFFWVHNSINVDEISNATGWNHNLQMAVGTHSCTSLLMSSIDFVDDFNHNDLLLDECHYHWFSVHFLYNLVYLSLSFLYFSPKNGILTLSIRPFLMRLHETLILKHMTFRYYSSALDSVSGLSLLLSSLLHFFRTHCKLC